MTEQSNELLNAVTSGSIPVEDFFVKQFLFYKVTPFYRFLWIGRHIKRKKEKKNPFESFSSAGSTGREAPSIGTCRALYDYTANMYDELSIRAGDVINIHDKQEDGWWLGELRGTVGIFPATYVEENWRLDKYSDVSIEILQTRLFPFISLYQLLQHFSGKAKR